LILSYVRNLIHFIFLFYKGLCGEIYSITSFEKIKKKEKFRDMKTRFPAVNNLEPLDEGQMT